MNRYSSKGSLLSWLFSWVFLQGYYFAIFIQEDAYLPQESMILRLFWVKYFLSCFSISCRRVIISLLGYFLLAFPLDSLGKALGKALFLANSLWPKILLFLFFPSQSTATKKSRASCLSFGPVPKQRDSNYHFEYRCCPPWPRMWYSGYPQVAGLYWHESWESSAGRSGGVRVLMRAYQSCLVD